MELIQKNSVKPAIEQPVVEQAEKSPAVKKFVDLYKEVDGRLVVDLSPLKEMFNMVAVNPLVITFVGHFSRHSVIYNGKNSKSILDTDLEVVDGVRQLSESFYTKRSGWFSDSSGFSKYNFLNTAKNNISGLLPDGDDERRMKVTNLQFNPFIKAIPEANKISFGIVFTTEDMISGDKYRVKSVVTVKESVINIGNLIIEETASDDGLISC